MLLPLNHVLIGDELLLFVLVLHPVLELLVVVLPLLSFVEEVCVGESELVVEHF